MKCTQCGANLSIDQLACPYCGAVNREEVKRKNELDAMQVSNQEYKQTLLKKEKWQVWYRIHVRVNIVLAVLFVLITVISFVMFVGIEVGFFNNMGSVEDMKRYYAEEDYENLYLCMHKGSLFDPENYNEYGHMALTWNTYMDFQYYFASGYEEYQQTGIYPTFAMEQCLEHAAEILTGNLSPIYESYSEENKRRVEPYREQVMIVLTGFFQIPEEVIDEIYGLEEYYQADPLIEYVMEVIPNE